MIRILSGIAAALTLVGCANDREAEAPVATETTNATEPLRPTLAGSEYEPYLALQGIDPQWADSPLHTDSNYTASLGLDRRYFAWRNTNLTYDRTDQGGVYLISLRSGMPGRCNSGPDLMLAYNQFAEDFALGAPAQDLKPKLSDAWASDDGWAEGELGKVMIRAIGGCPRSLVLKAL